MLGLISHQVGPTAFWALFSCPDQGRPTLHGWWAPSHSAIKERWGPGLAVRGSPRRQSPHRHPNPNPILRRGAASDGKHHRRRQRHPDAHAAAEDATAPTLPLHRTSLPACRWRPPTRSRPVLRPLRPSMVCYLSLPFSPPLM